MNPMQKRLAALESDAAPSLAVTIQYADETEEEAIHRHDQENPAARGAALRVVLTRFSQTFSEVQL